MMLYTSWTASIMGASVNRIEENSGDYLVHMAARLGNMEILERFQPQDRISYTTEDEGVELSATDPLNSTTSDRLLASNAESQTPPSIS